MFVVTFSRYLFNFNHVFCVHLTFLLLFVRFVKVFVYVFRVLGGISALLRRLLLLLREKEEIGGIVT